MLQGVAGGVYVQWQWGLRHFNEPNITGGLPGTDRTVRRTEVSVWRFGRAATPRARRPSYNNRRTHWRFESGASWVRRPFGIATQLHSKFVASLCMCKHSKRGTSLMTPAYPRH